MVNRYMGISTHFLHMYLNKIRKRKECIPRVGPGGPLRQVALYKNLHIYKSWGGPLLVHIWETSSRRAEGLPQIQTGSKRHIMEWGSICKMRPGRAGALLERSLWGGCQRGCWQRGCDGWVHLTSVSPPPWGSTSEWQWGDLCEGLWEWYQPPRTEPLAAGARCGLFRKLPHSALVCRFGCLFLPPCLISALLSAPCNELV